jgi:hypothetical protein
MTHFASDCKREKKALLLSLFVPNNFAYPLRLRKTFFLAAMAHRHTLRIPRPRTKADARRDGDGSRLLTRVRLRPPRRSRRENDDQQIAIEEAEPRRRFSRTNPRLGFQPSRIFRPNASGRKKRSCYSCPYRLILVPVTIAPRFPTTRWRATARPHQRWNGDHFVSDHLFRQVPRR